jgi:hypothetical protein
VIIFPRQKLLDIPEARVQSVVWAQAERIPGVRLWRVNVGKALMRGQWVQFGKKGMADLSGAMRYPNGIGRRLEIELKALDGRQRPEQREWQEEMEALGALYLMPRTLEEAVVPICEALGIDYVFKDVTL